MIETDTGPGCGDMAAVARSRRRNMRRRLARRRGTIVTRRTASSHGGVVKPGRRPCRGYMTIVASCLCEDVASRLPARRCSIVA